MQALKMFGFPVGFNAADDKLVLLEDDVRFEESARKFSKGMFGLLADDSYSVEDEPYYDFYKAICRKGDLDKFEARKLRFDSTVIMAGCAGGEFKKTAGHFHCQIPGGNMSYPELYQVIKGTAVFVMQKVDDENKTGEKMVVEDCIIAEVPAGEAVVIPPGYGHCTVNVGYETMVFINLVSCDSMNAYDSVKASQGMSCYIMQNGSGGFTVKKNPRYDFACEPKIVVPRDNATLGIKKDLPVYTAYLRQPDGFDYLNAPDGFVNEMLAVFSANTNPQ